MNEICISALEARLEALGVGDAEVIAIEESRNPAKTFDVVSKTTLLDLPTCDDPTPSAERLHRFIWQTGCGKVIYTIRHSHTEARQALERAIGRIAAKATTFCPSLTVRVK